MINKSIIFLLQTDNYENKTKINKLCLLIKFALYVITYIEDVFF